MSVDIATRARATLVPPLGSPNRLIQRARAKTFRNWLKAVTAPRRVLDLGGRVQPYRPLLAGSPQYIAVDVQPSEVVNVIGDAHALPFADGTFDLVLCTQVFYGLANPFVAASEIHRILEPGGTALLSIADAGPVEGPADFWRFTQHGIMILLRDFADVEIVSDGGAAASMLRTVNLWLTYQRPSWLRKTMNSSIVPVLNAVGGGIESVRRRTGVSRFAVNYSVRARKKLSVDQKAS